MYFSPSADATEGLLYHGTPGSTYGAGFGDGDLIGVAFDADTGVANFYLNGVSQGATLPTVTGGAYFAVC